MLLVGSEFFGRIGDGSAGESRKRGITAAYKYFDLFLAKIKALNDEATIVTPVCSKKSLAFLLVMRIRQVKSWDLRGILW